MRPLQHLCATRGLWLALVAAAMAYGLSFNTAAGSTGDESRITLPYYCLRVPYCPKPQPSVECGYQATCSCYARKPLPCTQPWRHWTCDKYCPKPLPCPLPRAVCLPCPPNSK